jgi:exoribonuclease-2
VHVDPVEVLTLEGFCKLRRELDAQPSGFLDSRIRRFQSFAEISTEPGPHFGLGLEAYATWTSPIRKYGDMINHRLLKAIIKGKPLRVRRMTLRTDGRAPSPQPHGRTRCCRLAVRPYLNPQAGTDTRFAAEIIDISRGGMRVRLVDNGAVAFIPAPFLHAVRDELVCSQENGTVQIKGEVVYKVTDVIDVTIAEVRMETRSVIARPAA